MKLGLEIRLFLIRHSKLILIIILSFISLVAFVQYLNNLAKEANANKYENFITNNNVVNSTQTSSNITSQPESSIYKENKEYTKFIEDFIDLCERQEITNAYNMLSENCKYKKYRTLEVFTSNYYNKVFNENYDVEVVFDGTSENKYKIIFKENILHTGKTENLEEIISYYTIEENVLGIRININ